MAAVPSMSEPQHSGDSAAVSHLVQKHVEEVLAWQRRNGVQKIPSKYSGDCEERKLALRFEKLLLQLHTCAAYEHLTEHWICETVVKK